MIYAPREFAISVLGRLERAARQIRRRLLRCRGRQNQFDRPNNADEWEVIYATPIIPVTQITSPIARMLERISQPGDVMLEAGCGGATISAELATAGRNIELADFSQGVLDRAAKLFEVSGLQRPKAVLADLTKPLPLPNGAVDITWSSGVLEHWTDEELVPIVREMARISRRQVVSLVPYAGSLLYRWGKWVAENDHTWPYGREIPRQTLRPIFERAQLCNIRESTVWPEPSLAFLEFVDADVRREATTWWNSLPTDDPIRLTQGYLLLTIGEIASRTD